ncbi:UNVERIFIED_CONTAM: hypothetical protein RMT77_001322 [Armadillidium vulgare]
MNASFYKTTKNPWETEKYEKFVHFTEIQSSHWYELYRKYLTKSKNLLTIFYENVVENPVAEVEKIVKFLGYQTNPQRLACLKKYPLGPAKRNHSKELFQGEEAKRNIAKSMRNFLEILHTKGISPPNEYEKVAEDL